MAGRKLISESIIVDAVRAGRTTVTVPRGAILTPLARDTARDQGITIIVGKTTEKTLTDSARAPGSLLCIGSDHGGYDYKSDLIDFTRDLGWRVIDVGTDGPRSCDYPDFAYAVARMVADGRASLGIMLDGAGIGSAIVCNKVPGIRAACAYNEFTAWNARAHNNSNILTLGSKTLGIEVCKRIVQTFLVTKFEGGRHERRVSKMMDVETRFAGDGD
jgi:ribose 5-phosphate isomerase B